MAKFTRLEFLNQVTAQGLVPLAYVPEKDVLQQAITASYEGGCRLFEFTNRGDNAIWLFAELVQYFQKEIPDLIIGAGSILDPGTASLYMSCGANFIVGPVFNPEVAKVCNRRKVAYMPGCGTASEVSTAEEYGVEIVKLFPGEAVGGPAFVKAILGPSPWTKVLITGGVSADPENLAAWFKAGATAVGMGSNLFKKAWLQERRFDEITRTVANSLKWIRQARGEKPGYHLEHIGIVPREGCTGMELAQWYAQAFNLRVKEGNSSIFLEGDGPGRIEVMKEASSTGGVHVAVAVADFEEAVNDLRARGIALDDSPTIKPNVKAVYLRDPDPAGNRVHLIWRKA